MSTYKHTIQYYETDKIEIPRIQFLERLGEMESKAPRGIGAEVQEKA